MTEPVRVSDTMPRTIAPTPGRDQSRGSTDQASGVSPVCAQQLNTAGGHTPYGARNMRGRSPVAAWIASVACAISSHTPAAGM